MIKTKPWSGGTDEEYETQHFGFGAQRFKIAVRQMVEEKITTWVKEMRNHLQETLNLNDTDKVTLTHSCNKLIRLYCERAGPSLEAIDDEVERLLQVPSNVLLREDEVQREQITDAEYDKLKEEVNSLRKRVERGALLEALLLVEEDELTAVEKACEMAKKDMEVLDMLCKNTKKSIDQSNPSNTDKLNLKEIISDTQFLQASVPFLKETSSIEVYND